MKCDDGFIGGAKGWPGVARGGPIINMVVVVVVVVVVQYIGLIPKRKLTDDHRRSDIQHDFIQQH